MHTLLSTPRTRWQAIRSAAYRLLAISAALGVVACGDDKARTYSVAGSISGLSAAGLVLQNNGGDNAIVPANAASFQFATKVVAGRGYNVTIAAQPSGLTCTVSSGAGTNVRSVVTNISIACSPITHTIAGTIAGLNIGGLVLQNNGVDNLTLAANSDTFRFATPVAAGGGYNVTVSSQPTGLTCSVGNGAGTNVLTDISGIQITCSASALSIGGTITGLTGGGLVLRNNGADDLTVAASAAAFEFAMPVAYGSVYAVTVLHQPAGQTCSVTQGAAIATTRVTNVAVTCANIVTYTLTASGGANGSIAPVGVVVVNSGSDQGFVATPNAGYAVAQWLLDGVLVQNGGDIYTLANIGSNHTLAVSFAQATLTSSVAALALAVNDTSLNAALTGTPRTIVLTNNGSITATNVSVAYPTWPMGTTASSTCGSVLAPASSCTITITPGSAATSNCTTGIAPSSDTITVSADNAADNHATVAVLAYGCIYQGGFVYSVDDTTANTGSIGGTVASQRDQVAAPASGFGPPGIIWSASAANVYDGGVSIWGIDQLATPASPSPNGSTSSAPATQISGQQNCLGNGDGACNSDNIVAWYSAPNTNPQIDRDYYAAGVCKAVIDGYSDWYLPAICELGPDSGNGICPGGRQTIAGNLFVLIQNSCVGGECLAGTYWSSTQEAAIPAVSAPNAPRVSGWVQYFSPSISAQGSHGKGERYGVRCTRALSP